MQNTPGERLEMSHSEVLDFKFIYFVFFVFFVANE